MSQKLIPHHINMLLHKYIHITSHRHTYHTHMYILYTNTHTHTHTHAHTHTHTHEFMHAQHHTTTVGHTEIQNTHTNI